MRMREGQLVNCLFRAIVSLPDSLCQRDRPLQERIVFFEAPYDFTKCSNAAAAQTLELLLATAWGVSTEGWCEDGYIYNIRRERDLLEDAMGDGDRRLLEISWGGPERIGYAKAADVDLFVTPRLRTRLDAALRATEGARAGPTSFP